MDATSSVIMEYNLPLTVGYETSVLFLGVDYISDSFSSVKNIYNEKNFHIVPWPPSQDSDIAFGRYMCADCLCSCISRHCDRQG